LEPRVFQSFSILSATKKSGHNRGKSHEKYHYNMAGEVEVQICEMACFEPTEGSVHWTMQIITDGRIHLEVVESVECMTDNTVCDVMKKTKSSRLSKKWCTPEANAEYVAKMEDVLDVYQRPYDPLDPVVCINETNKQLLKEICQPAEQPEKGDLEYERNGVVNVFMIFEPLAGKRETIVTETRSKIDFAKVLKYISDVMYPDAKKILFVTDNRNTHSIASLYRAFRPEEASRIADRLEGHYIPKGASWLNMAEIEIGIMRQQALKKPLPDMQSFKKEVKSWTMKRNMGCTKINWQFTLKDARVRLKKVYPMIS
jgi:hypothetical protein